MFPPGFSALPCDRPRYRRFVSSPTSALRERERELGALREGLERACAGAGTLLLVEGPPGVGKTELVREARAAAMEARVTPLEARGSELEQPFAFGIVRQLLEPMIGEAPGSADLFAGAAGPAARLFEPDEPQSPGAEVGFEALHSLYWLVVNLADRAPLLVSVDDCQWVDRDSLRFLAYLAQRIEGIRVAMLLAGRRPDSAADGGSLWAQVASRPEAGVLNPRPLSQSASVALARERLGAERGRGVLPRVSWSDRWQPPVPAGAAQRPGRGGGRAVGRRGERGAGSRSGRREPLCSASTCHARPCGERAGEGGRRAWR